MTLSAVGFDGDLPNEELAEDIEMRVTEALESALRLRGPSFWPCLM